MAPVRKHFSPLLRPRSSALRNAGDRHHGIPAGALVVLAVLVAAGIAAPSSAGETGDKAKMELGRKVFTKIAVPPCGVCHTLADAGTTGTIGAKLEELKPDAERVAKAVRDGVGVMPPYKETLTEEQIRALAYYVARAAGGGAK
jgi:mono/diheme cytochrome c family protein